MTKTSREHLITAMACLTLSITSAEEERQKAAQQAAPGMLHLDGRVREAVRIGDVATAALTLLETKLRSFDRAGM